MTLIEFSMVLIAGAAVILVFVLVPTLLALKRTAESVKGLADLVKTDIKPALHELTGVVSELNIVCNGIAENTDNLKRFMAALGEAGNNLHTINSTVGAVTGALGAASVWITGAKVAGKYMLQRYLINRGGK